MSAAMLLQAWADTLVTTGILVLLVLAIRKPFARHFGPRLAYTLWLVPALRLVLPPLPFGAPVVRDAAAAQPIADAVYLVPADALAATPASGAAASSLWSLADLLPVLFAVWAAGVLFVLFAAMLSHQRFRQTVLGEAVALEPIGTIRLVMTDAVDGPVAFGLLHRYVAVPHDFFARYAADERALAIDHELAHHRHGDLWANGAALLLLAAQWYNPFAWRAIRAFRFDQEAACDARVLTMADAGPRDVRTARYATAIAKAAVGSRLSLAAPMAVHDNLQERLTMLTRQDISKRRGLVGRLLVGSATLAVLATTATLVPAGIASASTQAAGPVTPPAAPAAPPPEAPLPPEAPAAPEGAHQVMLFTSQDDGGEAKEKGAIRREVTRTVVRDDSDTDGKGPAAVRHLDIRVPGGLSRDDILATLKEQGVSDERATAIVERLETRRKERFRVALAPVPPMPPIPPLPPSAWTALDGKAMAAIDCRGGQKPMPVVDRHDRDGKQRSRVLMLRCGDVTGIKDTQISALKRVRDQFARGDSAHAMSAEIRARVVADMNRAIADLERPN